MTITKEYQNAFTEVITILNYIDEIEYNKIPKNVISVIEQNKNSNYEYEMNEELDIFSQPMLTETKAILYNFFRDYWATPVQRQKIIKMQREERYKVEEDKRKKYAYGDIFKRNENNNNLGNDNINNTEKVTSLQVVKRDNFIVKLFNKIKKMFRFKK